MSEAILCPQVGQDLTEAKVVALHVKLGDTVKKGMIVADVESEKATFEVEAFASGIVVELPYQVGDMATVLEPLVVLGTSTDAKPKTPATSGSSRDTAPHKGKDTKVSALTPQHVAATLTGRSSPLARRTAESNGLEIEAISGTGPHGAVVLRDVEALVAKSGNFAVASAIGLNVKSLKDGKGIPVVFIHGFGAEIAAWRQIAMAIGLPNTLLAIDLPGHGASQDASDGFESIVKAVASTLSSMGTEFHLVGHSLGAAVAIALSAQNGLTIKSLTLFAPAGMGTAVDGNFIAGFLAAKSEAALAAQMKQLVNDPANLPSSMVKATQAAREAGLVTQRQAKVAAGLFEGSTQLFSVRSELARYHGPCRVIIGQQDGIIPTAETQRNLPSGIALHRLDNVGHLPFLEEQSLSARLITETVRSSG